MSSPLLPNAQKYAPAAWTLRGESGGLIAGFMNEFVHGRTRDERRFSLQGAGAALYEVAPDRFKELLWTLLDTPTPPRSILITSQEPYIPWELMIPSRRLADGTVQERPPLGVEFALGRWTHDSHLPPVPRIRLTDSYVVAPSYPGPTPPPLPHLDEEARMVLTAVPGDRIEPATLATLSRLRAARALLHFVCHGAEVRRWACNRSISMTVPPGSPR